MHVAKKEVKAIVRILPSRPQVTRAIVLKMGSIYKRVDETE